jgi:hypothetical protein
MHTLTVVIYLSDSSHIPYFLTCVDDICSFTMYPAVCARARQEVLERVGPTRRPTYEDIKDMKYLRAVINGAPLSLHTLHSLELKADVVFRAQRRCGFTHPCASLSHLFFRDAELNIPLVLSTSGA